MGDGTIPSNSSNPLLSRLDRLEFIMKYMERKTKFEGSESSNNISAFSGGELGRSGCMPMDMALKETHSKGSLIDRVASLESRLFQLCLDMESSSTSRTSSSGTCSQTSGDSSSYRSRGESSSFSLPTFNFNPNSRISQLHVMSTTHEIEEKSDSEEQKTPSTPPKQKLKKKNKPKKDGKSCKSEKKRTPPSWPLKLLGC
ncbi:hypothetical protein PanWU01x14_259580 [Parasponia andersonii]|uniref:Uncharacterized protein n=1 Tax=Parasponia andersonii TaxID=3476 RepID=A0A2P5B979_PARAD|nr:hypothetical protein PanWU01x14_259580 [Parasponia andersonii]